MKKVKHDEESFKKNAVLLSQDREGSLESLAMELGIRTGLLYDWRSQYLEKSTHSKSKQGIVCVREEKSLQFRQRTLWQSSYK